MTSSKPTTCVTDRSTFRRTSRSPSAPRCIRHPRRRSSRGTTRRDGGLDRRSQGPSRATRTAPALVEAPVGAGRTLLFTSTLDVDCNTLPMNRGYPPLVQQAIRHLARSMRSATRPTTSWAARSRYRRAISSVSRSAAPMVSAPCSRAIASAAAARCGSARPSALHLSRGRYRSDRRYTRSRRVAFVVNVDPKGSESRQRRRRRYRSRARSALNHAARREDLEERAGELRTILRSDM